MEGLEKNFPWTLSKTKVRGVNKKFDLVNVVDRRRYFQAKAGKEIEKLKEYFDKNTFIAYWLGKKNSGKGTYSKLMVEIFGQDRISHISVGDVVRDVHVEVADVGKRKKLIDYLKQNYRGYLSVDEVLKSLLHRGTRSLLPTEFILALVKREIDKMPKKTIFIDGFPRSMDQVSYSLYFRDLINHRDDPDVFIIIDIPEQIIDQRMKYRTICPKCHTSRSVRFLPTQNIGYDKTKKEFYLMCDNPECGKARMVAKEGDDLGIESIRERLNLDGELIKKVAALHGVPKILLRNAIPVGEVKSLVDAYEITPEYCYTLDKDGKVKVSEKSWVIKNDEGEKAYSLLAPPVVISLIRQLKKVLVG